MRFLNLFFLFSFCACGQQSKKYSVNPEAKKLNDSAISIARYSMDYKTAVDLLDKAIQIHINYFSAYNNKLSFLGIIKPFDFDKFLIILKNLNRLRPEDPEYYNSIGLLYYKKGDTILSQKYFFAAASHYAKILDTLPKTRSGYDVLIMDQAVNFILIRQESKGKDLLKKVYKETKDSVYKEILFPMINKSRQEILHEVMRAIPQ